MGDRMSDLAQDRDAYSVQEFCSRHSISRSSYYNLTTAGIGPKTFKLGTRTLISREAAARWRAEREAASNRGSKAAVHA
jgi:predicted DNA-binding transcriptional regulator AlpA